MIQTRLFISIYSGLCVYLVLIVIFGATGKFAYDELEMHKVLLEKNVEDLKSKGEVLNFSVEALQSDYETVAKVARGLLYLKEREGIIRIAGYKEKPRHITPGGLVAGKTETRYRPEPFLRALAGSAGILVFLFHGFSTKKRK
jgi:cell division protein FtsB